MPDFLDAKYRAARLRVADYAPMAMKRAGDRSLYKAPPKGVRGVENQATIKNQRGQRQDVLKQGFFRKPVDPKSLSTPLGKERLHAATPWKPPAKRKAR